MISAGDQVEHEEFGVGEVIAVLGSVATVEFFGEKIDVDRSELVLRSNGQNPVLTAAEAGESTYPAFRQSFEAVNLGVVPSDPDQLIKLTIGGERISRKVRKVLDHAPDDGACRIYMGYYGSGKSHHLNLVKAIALSDGWVTASVELDPKAADPAKPFAVYQELMVGLTFPMRADGSRNEDFFDLVREIRDNWVNLRSLKYLRSSQWFYNALDGLQYLTHRRDDQDYVSAVNWLAGQVKLIGPIRKCLSREGFRGSIPPMPQTRDTGLVYVFHLVVLNEILQALGYRGLALIIDEAEHVRNFNITRRVRANNFFDILARCAHPPRGNARRPPCDHDLSGVPPFWKEGPHFGLFVGLTEGEDTDDLDKKTGEMAALIHSADEVTHLTPPRSDDYEEWAGRFLAEAASHLGPKVDLLADESLRRRIAAILRKQFAATPRSDRLLRNWTKMASLPASVLLSSAESIKPDELLAIVDGAAQKISGPMLPWDD